MHFHPMLEEVIRTPEEEEVWLLAEHTQCLRVFSASRATRNAKPLISSRAFSVKCFIVLISHIDVVEVREVGAGPVKPAYDVLGGDLRELDGSRGCAFWISGLNSRPIICGRILEVLPWWCEGFYGGG